MDFIKSRYHITIKDNVKTLLEKQTKKRLCLYKIEYDNIIATGQQLNPRDSLRGKIKFKPYNCIVAKKIKLIEKIKI